MDGTDLVTGAFGNTGSVIAQVLRDRGRAVRTLTGHPREATGGLDVRPFTWGDPDRLAAAFDGVETFYNTYWMRMGDGHGSYDVAVDRCLQLIDAAERAGVRRIVHLSVAHPSATSPYPYFRGKARVEARLEQSPVPTLAVRPTLIFGGHSVLLNNLAWLLRKLPVFAVAGDGRYLVRPVHVDDIARLCVDGPRPVDEPEVHRAHTTDAPSHLVVDAVGPDRPAYIDLVRGLRDAIGARTLVVRAPTAGVLLGGRVLGAVVHDDVLDRDELVSTMEGLADTEGPPTGSVSLRTWIREHGHELGRSYRNERTARA
jgi:NADH dehydrogenase